MEWPPWGFLSPLSEGKKRRGSGIFVKEETMETSVAKGMVLNSEERNKVGRGSWWAQGADQFSRYISLRLQQPLSLLASCPQPRWSPEFKNFKMGPLSGSNPSPSVLQGKANDSGFIVFTPHDYTFISKLCLTADQFHLIWARLLRGFGK